MKPTEIGATFQIPKFEARAELRLANNQQLTGKIFLSILPSSPLGHTSVLDWFNEPTNFFPFLPEKSGEAEIINKNLVVEAVVDVQLNQDEVTEILEETVWVEQVEVHCDPFIKLTGRILLNMPSDRARLLDFLNQPEAFFSLKSENRSHIIQKKFITSVKELPSLPPVQPMNKERAKRNSSRAKKK